MTIILRGLAGPAAGAPGACSRASGRDRGPVRGWIRRALDQGLPNVPESTIVDLPALGDQGRLVLDALLSRWDRGSDSGHRLPSGDLLAALRASCVPNHPTRENLVVWR